MHIFKTRVFTKWAAKEGITDENLRNAVNEIDQGLIDAELGRNVYKKRIGLKGRGKRKSVRTLIAYKFSDKAFYVYGFKKNERENINDKELKALKLLAEQLLNCPVQKLQDAINTGELNEVK